MSFRISEIETVDTCAVDQSVVQVTNTDNDENGENVNDNIGIQDAAYASSTFEVGKAEDELEQQSNILGSIKTSSGSTIDDISEDGPVMVVFLRHFGCPACRKTISNINTLYPTFKKLHMKVVFIHQGPPEMAQETFNKLAPDLNIHQVLDEERKYYNAMNLNFGTSKIKPMLSPKVMSRMISEARVYGIASAPGNSDLNQFGGVFVYKKYSAAAKESGIQASFRHGTAFDFPDYASLAVIPQHVDAKQRNISDIEYNLDAAIKKRHFGRQKRRSKTFLCFPSNSGEESDDDDHNSGHHDNIKKETTSPSSSPFSGGSSVRWSLDQVLHHDSRFQRFKVFCIKEFAPESVLFWERISIILNAIRNHLPEEERESIYEADLLTRDFPIKILKEYKNIMKTIYEEHFRDGGDSELNVQPDNKDDASTHFDYLFQLMDENEEQMVHLKPVVGVFDEAKFNLNDSLYRFLDSKDAQLAAAQEKEK